MYPELTLNEPGVGPGWKRLAQAVTERMSLDTLDGIWVFRPLRIEKKEWGTAILALAENDRYRIFTAQYQHTIKGRERGAFTVVIEEVGSGPTETLDVLVAAVPKRTDEDPPVRIPLTAWYPEEDAEDGSPEPA
jgi:hypothetical protein